MTRSAAASLALPGAAALLDACSKPGATSVSAHANGPGAGRYWPAGSPYPLARQDAPVKWKLWRQPIKSGLAPEKGATLQIYNWADYIFPKVVKKFCAAYNCSYQVTTFNNMDEALAKMRTGQLQFDIFFPTPDILGKLITGKLLQPLNRTPIQPRLAESNLALISSGGPGALSFNEFNPLFNRDGVSLQATGFGGENGTWAGEGVVAGIYKNLAFSAGYTYFDTNGWRVNAELPLPASFDVASKTVRDEDVTAQMPCGPDVQRHIAGIREFEAAGYTHIALVQVGADTQEEFISWAASELLPAFRAS